MTLALAYVSTDMTGISGGTATRWVGGGVPLEAWRVDQNFWMLADAVSSLSGTGTVSISSVTGSGSNLYVSLSNGDVDGPIPMPIRMPNPRGLWATSTAYVIDDLVEASGNLYIVLKDHVSAGSFDENATDGQGNLLYKKYMTIPGSSLPTGGSTGMYLKKASSNNYECEWGFAVMATGATGAGTLTIAPAPGEEVKITPTAALDVVASSVAIGDLFLSVTTSGTASYTVSFGSGFKAIGSLETGAVTAKEFMLHFKGDGVAYREVSRTTAM